MKKFDVTAAIIEDTDRKILLVKRARNPYYGVWSLISGIGASREGLTPDEAVIGEVKYDIGVNFVGKILFSLPVENDDSTDTIHVYLGKISDNKIKINQEAATKLKWFTREEINNIETLGFQHKTILQKYFQEIKV